MTSVYFGAGIITLNNKQCQELKRLYEEPMLVKLKLSRKLPRDILYARRSALGVGLILPETAIAIATLKLYIGNVRMKSNVVDMIELNEQYSYVECGTNMLRHQF